MLGPKGIAPGELKYKVRNCEIPVVVPVPDHIAHVSVTEARQTHMSLEDRLLRHERLYWVYGKMYISQRYYGQKRLGATHD